MFAVYLEDQHHLVLFQLLHFQKTWTANFEQRSPQLGRAWLVNEQNYQIYGEGLPLATDRDKMYWETGFLTSLDNLL